MLKPIRLLAAAMAVSGWLFCLPVVAIETPPVTLDTLDKSMAELVEEQNLPSLSYAIIQPDEPAHIKAIGTLQKGRETRVTPDTAYRIASISKMFVGIAAMQLIEAGQINPESRVADVLPEFEFKNPWESTHPLKVKHFLESTSGFDEMSLSEFVYDNQPVMPLKEALSYHPDSHVSRWAPGTRHAYSNTAAAVTALLIEKVTGRPFTEYVQSNIFTPLKMNHTFYGTAPESVTMAEGHSGGNIVEHEHLLMYPAGGASSSITDMHRLLTFFVERARLCLTPKP
ncbi:beta-lactamase family protein [Salinimonas sp. HHU 13199]|uniref:Beta-lactamase family protein n=1 Tax=Salinimonas profundi TaxID=2729140 RepID=A0ABR8LKV1_9ALTE|nr:serine hydrolase domain-containing protein [Salinimonas profundi]MBD3585960.1 beta-lactamase family protein [Salinimonas profundi]